MTISTKLFIAAVLCVSFSGCYASHQIRPTELPRLNGTTTQRSSAYVAHPQGGGTTFNTLSRTVRHVRAVDGRVVQIEGEISANVITRQGGSEHFAAPVMSSLSDSGLRVAGGNRAEHVFPLGSVSYVEVRTLDEGLTTLAWSLPLGLAAGVGALAVVLVVLN